jgi:predicted AAA+ superfamily ATPase
MYKRLIRLPIGKKSFFLFGPRQTGKSTLIEKLLKPLPHRTINLLERDTFLAYKANPERLRHEIEAIKPGKTPLTIFIDEIQKIPELLDEVHLLIERYKGQIIFAMTGSSARKLKRASVNLLAGRAWEYFLFPLTHKELGENFQLERILTRGSLPPIVSDSAHNALQTLNAYAQIYLKEEVLDEALTRNIGAFSKFLEIAAEQSGSTVNYSNIARETHVTSKTVQGYYQILEDTLIAIRLPIFDRSARKRLVLHPKYYLFDTGIIQSLTGRASHLVRKGTGNFGLMFEHFVILETLRLASYAQKNWRFYYWRTAHGAEVDLVVKTPKNLWAIEVKSSEQVGSSQLQGLRSFKEDYPKARLVCVSTAPRPYKCGKITVINWPALFGPDFLNL